MKNFLSARISLNKQNELKYFSKYKKLHFVFYSAYNSILFLRKILKPLATKQKLSYIYLHFL